MRVKKAELIYVKPLIKHLNYLASIAEMRGNMDMMEGICRAIHAVSEAERVVFPKGFWIIVDPPTLEAEHTNYRFSRCGMVVCMESQRSLDDMYDYCPWCGTVMHGVNS